MSASSCSAQHRGTRPLRSAVRELSSAHALRAHALRLVTRVGAQRLMRLALGAHEPSELSTPAWNLVQGRQQWSSKAPIRGSSSPSAAATRDL